MLAKGFLESRKSTAAKRSQAAIVFKRLFHPLGTLRRHDRAVRYLETSKSSKEHPPSKREGKPLFHVISLTIFDRGGDLLGDMNLYDGIVGQETFPVS